jgi:hypothetical protein
MEGASNDKCKGVKKIESVLRAAAGTASHWCGSVPSAVYSSYGNMTENNKSILNLPALN